MKRKESNMKNRNNTERSKYLKDFTSKQREFFQSEDGNNQKKMMDFYKKQAKHLRLHSKNGRKHRW